MPLAEESDSPDAAWQALLGGLPPKRKWVVYLEAPLGRSTHVLRYLGRYTHRIALSDARLVSFDERRNNEKAPHCGANLEVLQILGSPKSPATLRMSESK